MRRWLRKLRIKLSYHDALVETVQFLSAVQHSDHYHPGAFRDCRSLVCDDLRHLLRSVEP